MTVLSLYTIQVLHRERTSFLLVRSCYKVPIYDIYNIFLRNSRGLNTLYILLTDITKWSPMFDEIHGTFTENALVVISMHMNTTKEKYHKPVCISSSRCYTTVQLSYCVSQ